jgi:hypothetical protein
MINSPAREIGARVELYEGSTPIDIFTHNDALKDFSIERMGEDGKFFGFGVCQELKVKLADLERKITVTKNNYLEVEFGVGCEYIYPYPLFRVDEISRDENNNDITIVAYDPIYDSASLTLSEINFKSTSIRNYAMACAAAMGVPINFIGIEDKVLDRLYPGGANFSGNENLREVMNAIAEATQSIYYIDHQWQLTFKRLAKDAEPVLAIDKPKYFTLKNKTDRTITTITHATELGDNVSASLSSAGVTQYVRNNPFWDLRSDIGEIVDDALAAIGGLTINQFNCSWRGNFAVEIGDKISMTTKDDEIVYGYVLNDTIEYNGGLKEKTTWEFTDRDAETDSNPTSLGDAIKNTYARVDKANQRIDLVVSSVEETKENIAAIALQADNITASVSSLETSMNNTVGGINDEINTLRSTVETKMTAKDVSIQIREELSSGVDSITTTTGYVFDKEGLTISKSGSNMETQITEDGMTVYRNDDAVLVANNEGVYAEDLHATTYLLIGNNSRIEDYGSDRTGCFWIGG